MYPESHFPGQHGPIEQHAIGNEFGFDEAESMRSKLSADIAFLEDRLERLMKQSAPNSAVIKNYRKMLESRRNVLQWLQSQTEKTASN